MSLSEWNDSRAPHAGGMIAPEFSAVGDAFAQNFQEGAELGACFAVMIDNELVADIRGGHSDRAKETPWAEDTLACIYSTGKAVLTLLIAIEVSNGRLSYEAPVAQYWPEFAANGKETITVAQALSHQGGLCALPEGTPPNIYLDWDATCEAIAQMSPLWEPGTANGYHPQTFGYIAGEILRRVTGKSVGELIRNHATQDLQIFCGMKPPEIARAAFMPKPPKAPDLGELNEYTKLAFLKPSSAPAKVAREDWMAAEIPASNMHADARSLTQLLHPFVNGGMWQGDPVLEQSVIDEAFKERIRGDDLVLPFHLSWAAGLMRNINRHFGPNENALGHAGFGGSSIVIDPENRMTIAYVMSKMSPHLVGDPRVLRLVDAVYEAV